jgi:hypothetical protein
MRRIALSSVTCRALPKLSKLSLNFHENPSGKRFVVHKVALGQVYLRDLPFRPVIIIPQLLDTHSICGRYMRTWPVLSVISTKASRALPQSYLQNSRTISATFTSLQFLSLYNSCLLFHFINSLNLTRDTN